MLDNVDAKIPICVNAAVLDDSKDGRGWANAKQTLLAAINIAKDGDEIWVAGAHNLAANITIGKPLTILGGFSGFESRSDQRDLNNRTQITADSGNNIEIYSAKGVVIDGFKFSSFSNLGALIIGSDSSVEVKNCFFYDNYMNGSGGAVSVNASVLTVSDTVFEKNTATANGGAISITGGTVIIQRTRFGNKDTADTGNSAMSGGAISAINLSDLTIADNCEFYRNSSSFSAARGGAIYLDNSTLKTSKTKFGDETATNSGNSAALGGAISAINLSDLTIADNCEFYRNSLIAIGTPRGGAIYLDNSTMKISRTKFGDETAADSGNTALTDGGAIAALSGSNVTISDNTQFYRNSSENSRSGGAVYLHGSTLDVSNSIFGGDNVTSGNKATGGTSANGGAIYGESNSNVTLSGAKIKYNSAAGGGGGVYHWGGILDIKNNSYIQENDCNGLGGGIVAQGTAGPATVTISDSYIQDNTSTGAGGGIRSLNCSMEIVNTEISGNNTGVSGAGGGISFASTEINRSLELRNSRITVNNAGSQGGGAINFTSNQNNVNLVIEKTIFDGNSATATGGAIYFSSSNGKISMVSSIVRNTPTKDGSAVYVAGGIGNMFVNSLFYNNNYETSSTAYGGALYLAKPGYLVNLTFFNNGANRGGAVYLSASVDPNYSIYNSVFLDNRSITDGLINNLSTSSGITLNTYNCYYVSMNVTGTLNDVDSNSITEGDPFLNSTNSASTDYLRPGSILYNEGYTGTIPGFTMPATDLAGNNRTVGAVDIGAYEKQ
jgi:predicted outer membrane repeat protein